MHIGFLQAYFSRNSVGGGELHTERLARTLESRGHEVTIFTDEPDDRRGGIEDLNVREYPTPIKKNPLNELTLAQRAFADMQKCDVLTLTDDSAWRGVDVPVPTAMVFHIVWHGWVERHRPLTRVLREKPQALVYRHIEKKICRKTDTIVSISPNIRKDILLAGSVGNKIVEIPNGVDVERFSPINTTENDRFTVYFQGRLVEMKNPELLIEAARHSAEDWRLAFGGDGPMRETLEQMVVEYNLTDRTEFLGYVPDAELPGRYARADLFALPSTYEGMPLTILEAAACGTAIIASPRAATDFVTPNIGRVVENDAKKLSRTIDNLSNNRDISSKLGDQARRKAEKLSWKNIAVEYEEFYKKLT